MRVGSAQVTSGSQSHPLMGMGIKRLSGLERRLLRAADEASRSGRSSAASPNTSNLKSSRARKS
eukprot:3718712-Pyramimonas_sp.AAC.1